MTRPQALQQQLSEMQAAVPVEHPPAFEIKSEPAFCSESDILRQRAAFLSAEVARISAATASVHTWTLQQHEQLKAINEDLPLAGDSRFFKLVMPRIIDAQSGLLSSTLLNTAAIDECASSAAAELDELVAAAGRLKQSNGLFHRNTIWDGIFTCALQVSCSSCGTAC